MIAVIASLLLISLYIGFRFEWKFAVPVLIALAHDLLITAGVYALSDREVTTATVAALLTIMGYSLYDTVIVFDRIRENVPRMPRATFSQIANRSMSEVFTRSLATSFAVLLPVGSLLLFGGETLKDFAFALLVGVLSGAYSSIFIATPVLVEWKERELTYMRRRRLMLQEFGGHIPAFPTGAMGEPVPARRQRRARTGSGRAGREAPPRDQPGLPGAQRRVAPVHGRTVQPTQTAQRPPRDPAARGPPPRAPDGDGDGAASVTTARARGSAVGRDARIALGSGGSLGPAGEAVEVEVVEAPAAQKAREALAMGLLVWVMMGIAVWHFTVFLPDRFWGGIVGAFLAAFALRRDLRLHRERRRRCPARPTPTSSRP